MSWIARTRTGRKFVSSQRYRIILSAAAAFASNLLYAVYHGVLGVLNRSLWFIAMCAFYGILATMRFSAILCEGSHHLRSSDDTELFVMGFSGILLIILGIVLAAVNYISLSQNIAAKHEEIMMITIATYTFCKTADSRESVNRPKSLCRCYGPIRNISYAEVSASVLTLQRSMLVSFGSVDRGQIRMMNATTGAAVCLFVLMLGLSMITKSNRERNLNNGKIQTCKNQ